MLIKWKPDTLTTDELSQLMTKPTKWHVCPAKTLDQPGHPPSLIRILIRVFTVRMKKAWLLSYPQSPQRRLWSDWADAQADESSLGAQSFCWFCHDAAHLFRIYVLEWLQYLSHSTTYPTKWHIRPAQADLSLRWAHRSFCCFVVSQLILFSTISRSNV